MPILMTMRRQRRASSEARTFALLLLVSLVLFSSCLMVVKGQDLVSINDEETIVSLTNVLAATAADDAEQESDDPDLPTTFRSATTITFDATNLGMDRSFYDRSFLEIKIGNNQVKTFHKVLGNSAQRHNSPGFVGESETGDSLQLLRYTSPQTGREILVGSMVELDMGLIYQFQQKQPSAAGRTSDSLAEEQILVQATVTHDSGFPSGAEPVKLDTTTQLKMEKAHQEGIQLYYSVGSTSTLTTDDDDDSKQQLSPSEAEEEEQNKDDIDIISLLIVWTRQSECRNYNLTADCTPNEDTEDHIRALIDASIAESNAAYTLSDIPIQLKLVHAYRHPTFEEETLLEGDKFKVGPFGVALERLAVPWDGHLDDVHELRRKYNADMVSMVIDNDLYCGVGFIGTGYFYIPSAPFMFSVFYWFCATGRFVLAHELGHNMVRFIDAPSPKRKTCILYNDYVYSFTLSEERLRLTPKFIYCSL
jgi:hypothetical protein